MTKIQYIEIKEVLLDVIADFIHQYEQDPVIKDIVETGAGKIKRIMEAAKDE